MADVAKRTKQNGHNSEDNHELLRIHRAHLGVYARVARQLGVDASYVSRVARGERESDRVTRLLFGELRKISSLKPQ